MMHARNRRRKGVMLLAKTMWSRFLRCLLLLTIILLVSPLQSCGDIRWWNHLSGDAQMEQNQRSGMSKEKSPNANESAPVSPRLDLCGFRRAAAIR